MNIVLVGEEAAGNLALRALLGSTHRLVAVMASESRSDLGGTLWATAHKHGCTTWPARLVKDPAFSQQLKDEKVDVLLNIHSLFVIHPEVVQAPRLGSFNLHPGPLPRYAGLNAPSWALVRGERTHGVTLHWMLAGIDTGPIAYQAMVDVTEDDTGLTVSGKCVKAGLPLVEQMLSAASLNPSGIPRIEQDLSLREYFGREVPNKGFLDWGRPARDVRNFIRAFDYGPFRSPWGVPRTRLDHSEIGVIKATLTGKRCDADPGTVGKAGPAGVEVACGDEWLRIDSILIGERHRVPADLLQPGTRLLSNVSALAQ